MLQTQSVPPDAVVCVEAAPRYVRLIEASAARNGFGEGLRVVHAAATDQDGSIEFVPSGPWGTIANPAVHRAPRLIQARTPATLTVPALPVDSLLASLGWQSVRAVKLDVEGAELAVLRGMHGLLSREDASVILYESNSHALGLFGHSRADFTRELEQYDYSSFSVEPGRLIPFDPHELEPQSVINCLAVKARPPGITGWRVAGSRGHEETVARIVDQSRSSRVFDRAYLVAVLAEADESIRVDPQVQLVLDQLRRDGSVAVRRAAAWSQAADHQKDAGLPNRL
jgi:FkbM family methyltransferase